MANKFSFFPETYVLPNEYNLFLEQFKKKNTIWIMKPIGRAQGKGIFLFNKISQISDWKRNVPLNSDAPQAEKYIVQQYILNPYLIGRKKFDLRLYALVMSYFPLVVWIHRSGFCRFSNVVYNQNKEDLNNTFMHLTNHSIQKSAENYDTEQGVKWSVYDLRIYLMTKFNITKIEKLFDDIQDIIIRSFICVSQSMMQDKHSYEIYGFDLLFDHSLKPWLIEVNACPSFSKSNSEDYQIKYDILSDLLDVVDMEKKRKGDEINIRGFDKVYDSTFLTHRSKIGCHYSSSKT